MKVRFVDVVRYSDPDISSHAALVLLKKKYKSMKTKSDRPKWRIWLSFRNRFLSRMSKQGTLTCFYCGKSPLYKNSRITPRDLQATIDHIVPRSKGGKEFDYSNLAVCCYDCNNKKGDKSLEDFTGG